ncbi:gluconate 2-dehydrogenase subunit 3 family protein [Desertivirga xinjiangensis]|uniref:gluconate 2-dehydrogenase subunit 3 family protein n=1 Tax=Desertivirga xinjiangensis TaxID=539206 RepID=UPI00210B77DC|nr:gluconate 2-dehydrogenase subunit 3 family protein [Pedobacter xinjiangensis]
MNRREALSTVAWLLGGTIISADLFTNLACRPKAEKYNDLFTQEQISLLDEVAETILPATNTPGAKDAKVGEFMGLMVRDCYKPEDQKIFINGIGRLEKEAEKKFKKKFSECNAAQRTELLTELDKEQKAYSKDKSQEAPNHYFKMIKELTLLGFFTSEVGATKALRYVSVPGRYDGCIPYKKGDRAFS